MKKNVLNALFDLDLNVEKQNDLYQILVENLERVEFVKYIGKLPNVLFVSEKGSNYSQNLFTAFNVRYQNTNDDKLVRIDLASQGFESEEIILKELDAFFKSTDDTLYMAVGLNIEYDRTEVARLLVNKEVTEETANVAKEQIGYMPDWYKHFQTFEEVINH